VKRTLITLAAAFCVLVAVVAADALSLERWRPEPVEFELAAPAPTRAGAARSGAFVSKPLRAPKRFNLVGFNWRGAAEPGIAVRVRRSGERWGRWTTVPAHTDGAPDPGRVEHTRRSVSAPVWAGQADWVQYRMSRRVPRLRLHFLNTTGTATAADRARTKVRRFANNALLAVARIATARAQDPQPPIVPRDQWGAANCPPRSAPSYGEVKMAFVHHTVSANDYSPEEAPAAVLAICRYHRNSNGWDDIGYNFLVDKYGTIYEGRAGGVGSPVVGAQAQGYNAQSTGIANIGTHTSVPQTEAALNSMARLIRWKLPLHGQPTVGKVFVTSAGGSSNRYPRGAEVELERISGHRDGNSTSCPGEALYFQLGDLRARVGNIAPARPRTRVFMAARPRTISFANQVRVTGLVRTLKGQAVGGAAVQVQEFIGRLGWKTIATTTAAGDGRFAALIAPAGKRILRARFAGSPQYVASTSKQSTVNVRAVIQARRSVSRTRVGRTPQILGRVNPAKSRLVVIVQRRDGARNRRVARFVVRARKGRFRKGYRLKSPGLYRFYAVFLGDAANLSAVSKPFYVRASG
jgi:hypothetical protein